MGRHKKECECEKCKARMQELAEDQAVSESNPRNVEEENRQ
jgi:hypothetical protein